jgi:hypothetical protein
VLHIDGHVDIDWHVEVDITHADLELDVIVRTSTLIKSDA